MTVYPVIGEPPVLLGAFQDTVTLVPLTERVGWSGALGADDTVTGLNDATAELPIALFACNV
jgi:hypothetical protein